MISFWLWRRRLPVYFVVLPMLFMLVLPAWAMLYQLPEWLAAENPNWMLIFVAAATLLLEAWMLIEAFLMWPRAKGVLEEALPPLRAPLRGTAALAETRSEGGRSC